MFRHKLPQIGLVILTAIVVTVFQPFSYLKSFAQPGCQEFKETGKKVCGKFLQYWQQNGGLRQQGFPLSNEFQEKSDLNDQTYTVQYFERAVFEFHPENQPPNDVLLSQLGTFWAREKYGNPPRFPNEGTGPSPAPPGIGGKYSLSRPDITITLVAQSTLPPEGNWVTGIGSGCGTVFSNWVFELANTSNVDLLIQPDWASFVQVDDVGTHYPLRRGGGCGDERGIFSQGTLSAGERKKVAIAFDVAQVSIPTNARYLDLSMTVNSIQMMYRYTLPGREF